MFYVERLSDDALEVVTGWAEYCLVSEPRSRKLAAYLGRVLQLEIERRSAEESGHEVLEVSMTQLQCERWSGPEVAAALTKLSAIERTATGEAGELMEKLYVIVLAEACHRLDR
jgi:hypothetical protein